MKAVGLHTDNGVLETGPNAEENVLAEDDLAEEGVLAEDDLEGLEIKLPLQKKNLEVERVWVAGVEKNLEVERELIVDGV